MSKDSHFNRLHDSLAARFPGKPVAGRSNQAEKLHLYHAPNSICSQKVRAVLAQIDQPYESHLVNIFEGENYDPAYVRLRMSGCVAIGLPLAGEHLGSTSVSSAGCDACVVPTLVDADAAQVLVDSRRICLELDRANPAAPGALMPAQLRARIEAEIAIVDELPNYQLLAVGVGKAPASGLKNGFSIGKVARCDALLAEHADDEALCAAYASKRAKEQMAADRLFDAAPMARAYQAMAIALRELDARLAATNSGYLLADTVTMADLFWGVELIRLDDLGLSILWADGRLPRVADYFRKICALPAIAQAVIDWPGARLTRRPDLDAGLVETLTALAH